MFSVDVQKLRQIEKLKEERAAGKTLQLSQLQKLEKEAEFRAEMAKLKMWTRVTERWRRSRCVLQESSAQLRAASFFLSPRHLFCRASFKSISRKQFDFFSHAFIQVNALLNFFFGYHHLWTVNSGSEKNRDWVDPLSLSRGWWLNAVRLSPWRGEAGLWLKSIKRLCDWRSKNCSDYLLPRGDLTLLLWTER